MGESVNEENVEVPTELPPYILEEDLEVGPPQEEGIRHTREPGIDPEEKP